MEYNIVAYVKLPNFDSEITPLALQTDNDLSSAGTFIVVYYKCVRRVNVFILVHAPLSKYCVIFQRLLRTQQPYTVHIPGDSTFMLQPWPVVSKINIKYNKYPKKRQKLYKS